MHLRNLPAAGDELLQVPRQGRRIAGNVSHVLRSEFAQLRADCGPETGAWRINHDEIRLQRAGCALKIRFSALR